MLPCILYEDADIVVVDKPSGMAVHPAPGRSEKALCTELVKRYPDMASVGSCQRPGVVHRLDIETSGVMVFARNESAYLKMRCDFETHVGICKTYLAVVHGAPGQREGTIVTGIAPKSGKKKMQVVECGGKKAVTHWRVLSRQGQLSLVEFHIETGRTHQIRVHARHLGTPIVGDRLYGDSLKDMRLRRRPARLLLHAVELAFDHPGDGRRMCFSAEVPHELVYAI